MKLYLDTNIWIDYLDKTRKNHSNAVKLFNKIKKEKHLVFVSELHIYETKVHKYYDEFEKAKNKLWKQGLCIGIKVSYDDKNKAKKLNDTMNYGKADCLHCLVAKRKGAILVSSDSHWEEIASSLGMRNFDYKLFFEYF